MACSDDPNGENCYSKEEAYILLGDFTLQFDFYVYSKSVDLGKTENYESKSIQWLDKYVIDKVSDIGEKSFILQANTVEIHDE